MTYRSRCICPSSLKREAAELKRNKFSRRRRFWFINDQQRNPPYRATCLPNLGEQCDPLRDTPSVTLKSCKFSKDGLVTSAEMYTASQKICKDNKVEPTEFEESVAQAFFELENTNQELTSDLKDLLISSAWQVDISGSKKAVVIDVLYWSKKSFRNIHSLLIRELEKKFSGKDVVLVTTMRIVRTPKKDPVVQMPLSRSRTTVHEALLEDVVYPAKIVGKRIRYSLDGSEITKCQVFLDPKAKTDAENKLDTFSGVYRKLSGKDVIFDFPVVEE